MTTHTHTHIIIKVKRRAHVLYAIPRKAAHFWCLAIHLVILSFHYRDNSVLCTFEWVFSLLVDIFITFNKENYHVYCFMQTCAFWLTKHWSIYIGYWKLKYYVKKWNTLLSLLLKENPISNIFTNNILQKYLPKRESTHENIQSYPTNEEGIVYRYQSVSNCNAVR